MSISIAGILYSAAGLGALRFSYSRCRKQLAFQANAKLVTGTVTAIDKVVREEQFGRSIQKRAYYAPVVEFRTESGAIATFQPNFHVHPNRYTCGMAMEVLYNPADPSEAQFNSRVLGWLFPLACGVVGLVCTALGIAGILGVLETSF